MKYKGNYGFKTLPDFQDGDTLSCNYSRQVVTEVPQNLVFEGNPNMFNCNLTGSNTGKCANVKKDLCYWEHTGIGLENFPTYSGEGATCGPDVSECRHVYDHVEIDLQAPIPLRKDIDL